ncbi:MAG: molybdenum cofactor guanylyltransferase [Cyanophyceae cyanobacterium]
MSNLPPSHPQALTAIILAGGRSARMGRDKALISIQGVPLLTRTCLLAQSCADLVYILTRKPEQYRALVPESCCLVPDSGRGPLVAFSQGLALVETPWVLLLACDLPLLQASDLWQWSGCLSQVSPHVTALLPQRFDRWEPLCGFYRYRCLPGLQEFLRGGGQSFQRWLDQQLVQELPVPNLQALFNCNTPADWKQVTELLKLQE